MLKALVFALSAVTAQAHATPALWVPGAVAVGEGRLDWLGLRIYEAKLSAPPAFDAREFEKHPFVLELTYRRTLRGRDIAQRSIAEMRRSPMFRAEHAQRWEQAMAALFPDVRPGDRIAGVNRPGAGAAFHVNGKLAGEVADPAFAASFFGIWLAPTTSEPALRDALLGARK